jgi:uncharacterized membrane protein
MLPSALTVVSVMASGVVAGVFFALAVSVLPALSAMPPEQYIQTHQLLGKGYHPVMPLLVGTATAADVALAVLAPASSTRYLAAAGAVALAGVMAVSQLGNVPINKVVHATSAGPVSQSWADPRPAWRHWHMLRTWMAFAALILNTVAVVLRA